MDKPNPKVPDAIRRDVEASWHRFLDLYEPLRPELYRYCRHLTRSPWDADDLVQDALFRAFAKLGCMNEPPENPRAWLFRIASNLWIDRVRALQPEPEPDPERASSREPRAVREAAGTLLSRLSPQERAAVALKEAFNFTLEEIAEALSTTLGTVKSALHRGRGKLIEPADQGEAPPKPQILELVGRSRKQALSAAIRAVGWAPARSTPGHRAPAMNAELTCTPEGAGSDRFEAVASDQSRCPPRAAARYARLNGRGERPSSHRSRQGSDRGTLRREAWSPGITRSSSRRGTSARRWGSSWKLLVRVEIRPSP